jgi:hypothetical protein
MYHLFLYIDRFESTVCAHCPPVPVTSTCQASLLPDSSLQLLGQPEHVDSLSQLLQKHKHTNRIWCQSDYHQSLTTTTRRDSLQAGNHPFNKNLGPSFFRLSINNFTGPSFPLAFMTLLLTTSAGAQIVVATVPESAEERIWSGMPFSSPWERRDSLKKS